MILYNRRVGEELQRAGVGLLRTHAGTTNENYMTLAMETGCREIAWLGSAAGTYVTPSNNTGHSGLSLACYTHASSPLRRYVDLVNQRWIRALFFGFPPPISTAPDHEYNVRSKRIRRLERDMYFLNRVLTSHDELPSSSGYVLEIKKSHGGMEKWRVYVPEWKRVVLCVFVSGLEDDKVKKGTCVTVRMYLDTRQGDWSRRFIYQALKQST
jgi:exoribonuclease R